MWDNTRAGSESDRAVLQVRKFCLRKSLHTDVCVQLYHRMRSWRPVVTLFVWINYYHATGRGCLQNCSQFDESICCWIYCFRWDCFQFLTMMSSKLLCSGSIDGGTLLLFYWSFVLEEEIDPITCACGWIRLLIWRLYLIITIVTIIIQLG